MKGILHKEEYGWVVRYKKHTPGPWFEVPLCEDDCLKYNADLFDYLDEEIEFEIIDGNIAKLISKN